MAPEEVQKEDKILGFVMVVHWGTTHISTLCSDKYGRLLVFTM